jgi:hypothetical protein
MRLLNVVAALPFTAMNLVGASDLNLLMWNPHWECFAWNLNDCKAQASKHADDFLKSLDIDFANFVEMPGMAYPEPWQAIEMAHCGQDLTALVFNSARWKKSTAPGTRGGGCMETNPVRDRPFVINLFEQVAAARPGMPSKVIAVGGHFPHNANGYAVLKASLGRIMQATGVTDVVVIADTNAFRTSSSEHIAQELGFASGHVLSTDLENTCCWPAFHLPMTFDRIIANFGSSMSTKVLIEEPVPKWAEQEQGMKKGAFHKPVLGTLHLSSEQEELAVEATSPVQVVAMV